MHLWSLGEFPFECVLLFYFRLPSSSVSSLSLMRWASSKVQSKRCCLFMEITVRGLLKNSWHAWLEWDWCGHEGMLADICWWLFNCVVLQCLYTNGAKSGPKVSFIWRIKGGIKKKKKYNFKLLKWEFSPPKFKRIFIKKSLFVPRFPSLHTSMTFLSSSDSDLYPELHLTALKPQLLCKSNKISPSVSLNQQVPRPHLSPEAFPPAGAQGEHTVVSTARKNNLLVNFINAFK